MIGRNVADFITCPKITNDFRVKVKEALYNNLIAVHFEVVIKYDGKREKRKCCIKKSTEEPSTALVNFYSCEDLN
ncbi:hypothetical protein [Desulforegula conservatrix]|uniref:hypothetical protein n=1 Tax=Desulforegula conservatrix TaxID=153026 RepID=UPI0004151F93|nr:hypothetical protein [Desulforegula conservatrix]